MKYIVLLLLILFFSCNPKSSDSFSKEFKCGHAQKVLKIAEEEWLKIYGEKIYKKKPFVVKIINDTVWTITGTLPVGYDGGVPYAEINAKTCEIIKIVHSK